MHARTLFDHAHSAGMSTAALQWPATAGADIDWNLPLIEDMRKYPDRWTMALRTSSARMVEQFLEPRRAAGVHLSHVHPDDLVVDAAREVLTSEVDLAAVRLTGLAAARITHGMSSTSAQRALADTWDALEQILAAFAPRSNDQVFVVPGRPLIPTTALLHPNTVLATDGLLHPLGAGVEDFSAAVWPDGPYAGVHIARDAPAGTAAQAIAILERWCADTGAALRMVSDGIGATERTDVIAVLTGGPGVVFGASATSRPWIAADDPYYAGPQAVADPSASIEIHAVNTPACMAGVTTWAELGRCLLDQIGSPAGVLSS